MSTGATLTFYVIPWSSLFGGLFGAVVGVAALIVPGAEVGPRMVGLGFGLFLVVTAILVVLRRLARLRVGEQIEYRRPFLHLDLPLSSAKAVRVDRRLSLHFPTYWDVVVEVKGRDLRLPLAAHYWFGGHLLRRARTVAEHLDVPLEDPTGEGWRASRFLPLRLLGAGHDWFFVLTLSILVVPTLFGLGLLALGMP